VIREYLPRFALFLLPFVLFGIYVFLQGRRGMARPATPWTWLFVTGLTLVIVSFVILGLTDNEPTKGVYIPPHVVDGHIVAGHVE